MKLGTLLTISIVSLSTVGGGLALYVAAAKYQTMLEFNAGYALHPMEEPSELFVEFVEGRTLKDAILNLVVGAHEHEKYAKEELPFGGPTKWLIGFAVTAANKRQQTPTNVGRIANNTHKSPIRALWCWHTCGLLWPLAVVIGEPEDRLSEVGADIELVQRRLARDRSEHSASFFEVCESTRDRPPTHAEVCLAV